METPEPFEIGGRPINQGTKPLFLPDIGTFFNRDIPLAISIIDSLADAGLTLIKGEILQNTEVCLPGDLVENYLASDGSTILAENYRSLIERKTVPLEAYRRIFGHCARRQVDFVLSVYDFEGAAFAKEIGAVALKISSSNITHYPLITYVAGLGLPIVLDTGHATLAEAERAVAWCRAMGENRIITEHSPPAPPNPVSNHNLMFMGSLAARCGTFIGLSDHHLGSEMLLAAIPMGAVVLEKGVAVDSITNEQDLQHALSLSAIPSVMKSIDRVHSAIGDGADRDLSGKPQYKSRMGMVASKNLSIGAELTLDSVRFAFPAIGIPTEFWPEIEGMTAAKPIKSGTPIYWSSIHARLP
ncbi:MAG: N-acetylneuraminate synthase family protein [Dinoroseobacter sp.]|nr:N-acetylneuraminate synthase family protein [Dinoroseobacter sp.]